MEQVDDISKINDLEERSEYVQEALNHPPHWILKWGTYLIFFILIIILNLTYFTKYPDVINGVTVLSTETPPIKLITKSNGVIKKIFYPNKSNVTKGISIAEIENPLNENAANYLKTLAPIVSFGLKDNFKESIVFFDTAFVFGDLQVEYNSIKKNINELNTLTNSEYYTRKIKNLNKQINNHKSLVDISKKQIKLIEHKLENGEDKLIAEKKLFANGVIAKMDYYKEESEYSSIVLELENLRKNKVQSIINIDEFEKQLNELEFENNEKKRKITESIILSLDNIKNNLYNWKQNYILEAPVAGELNYIENVTENQYVAGGTNLFTIVPTNHNYICNVHLPVQGYGKIQIGQTAWIKLHNYPYQEYGQLKGVVSEISIIPNQEKYLVKIKLNEGLKTTYNKKIEFKPEMVGTAEIITEDLRLIERLFYRFKQLFK